MRKFDWFISAAVALLYAQVGNDYHAEQQVSERYDPDRDTNLLVAFTLDGEWLVNWPLIFSGIALLCFIALLWKEFSRPKNS